MFLPTSHRPAVDEGNETLPVVSSLICILYVLFITQSNPLRPIPAVNLFSVQLWLSN